MFEIIISDSQIACLFQKIKNKNEDPL